MAHRRLLPDNKGLYNVSKFYFIPKPHPLNDGIGKDLPKAYKQFYSELQQEPSAVHYIPNKEKYTRDPETGRVTRVHNEPPALIFPKAFHTGLWGGSGIVKGFYQPDVWKFRFPKFWAPKFKSSVVYSEVLDLFITAIVTNRTIQLIHKHYGFDHYLLQTPACDLRSDLALKIKRKILLTLDKKDLPHQDPEKRERVYEAYKHYLEKYDSEYIQWYGLQIHEAVQKMQYEKEKAAGKPLPLKLKFRQELLEELRSEKFNAANIEAASQDSSTLSIFKKLNPFRRT